MGNIIDLTMLVPYRIIFICAQCYAFYNITHSFLKEKVSPYITFFSIFIQSSLIYEITRHFDFLQNSHFFIFIVFSFITICFTTQSTLVQKLLTCLFALISHFLASLFSSMIMMSIHKTSSPEEVFHSDNVNLHFVYEFLMQIVLEICLSFIFSGILKYINIKKGKIQSNKLYALFSFFQVSHILTVLLITFCSPIYDTVTVDYGYAIDTVVYAVVAVIIIFDCAFPFFIDRFERLEIKNRKTEEELLKSKLDYRQIEMLKEEKKEFRKLKHDYANIISTAKGFIEIGKNEKAIAILDEFGDDLQSLLGFSICSNETINTVLYIKKCQAEENGITLDIKVSESGLSRIDDYDMCRILSNIIDNSINAVKKIDGKKICTVDIQISPDEIIVTNENPFVEQDFEIKAKSLDHGHGISIIKSLSKKYNGSYTSSRENGIWTCVTRLDNKSQIATPPPANFTLTNSFLFFS